MRPGSRNIARFECKYLLTEAQAVRVRARLAPYIEPDPFARRAGGRYRLCSLYLDTADLSWLRETHEGCRNRRKLRVRSYGDEPGEPVFLEIKRRCNALVTKTRVPAARSSVCAMLAGRRAAVAGAEEFAGWIQRFDARPVALIRYQREAYVCVLGDGSRVTFDRQVESRVTDRPEVVLDGTGWCSVLGRRVVLELKFIDRFPRWMADAVHACELQRVSCSKYGRGVAAATRFEDVAGHWRAAP